MTMLQFLSAGGAMLLALFLITGASLLVLKRRGRSISNGKSSDCSPNTYRSYQVSKDHNPREFLTDPLLAKIMARVSEVNPSNVDFKIEKIAPDGKVTFSVNEDTRQTLVKAMSACLEIKSLLNGGGDGLPRKFNPGEGLV